jgi:hypothetical protein
VVLVLFFQMEMDTTLLLVPQHQRLAAEQVVQAVAAAELVVAEVTVLLAEPVVQEQLVVAVVAAEAEAEQR